MSKRQRLIAWLLGALGLVGLPSISTTAEPVQVAVSVPPQAYFVDRIGGHWVEVQVLIPPATPPAAYEPTPQQILALGRARLYVKVGHPAFPFEKRQLDSILRRYPHIRIVDMVRGVDLPQLAEAGAEQSDPHVWLAPDAVDTAARNIARALSEIDPDHATDFQGNLEHFRADIAGLDREIHSALEPLEQRRFMVYHQAWGYFAMQYGLEQVAIEAGGKEPSPASLIAMIEEARRDGVQVVFVQKGFSDRSARVIADEIGARVEFLDPLAYDWLDNLRHVAQTLREALGGE
jgi:zinc transport system substrate-binding protein